MVSGAKTAAQSRYPGLIRYLYAGNGYHGIVCDPALDLGKRFVEAKARPVCPVPRQCLKLGTPQTKAASRIDELSGAVLAAHKPPLLKTERVRRTPALRTRRGGS